MCPVFAKNFQFESLNLQGNEFAMIVQPLLRGGGGEKTKRGEPVLSHCNLLKFFPHVFVRAKTTFRVNKAIFVCNRKFKVSR